MNNGVLNKKIPTVLGMIIIIVGLSITTILAGKPTNFQSGAQANTQPQGVRISNQSDTSFTISYTTLTETNSYINYGATNNLDQIAYDERDNVQKLNRFLVHNVTLKNLTPESKYYFNIISGGTKYLNRGNNFEVSTTKTINTSESNINLSGKVILPDSSTPKEAIAYLTIGDSQVISKFVNNDGTYNFNLNKLLNIDLSGINTLTKDSVVKIFITNGALSSNITLYYLPDIKVPTITLSNDYDFRHSDKAVSSPSASLNSFPSLKTTSSLQNEKSLQILTPKSNQTFNNQKPDINGTATPNQSVNITIHSQQQIQTTVTTDSNGNWIYQPTTNLDPGTHTITVSSKDSSGIIKTITQSFTVYAQEITPTPTLIPTKTPLNTPSPTPTIQQLPVAGDTSIIAAGIAGLLIAVAGGLIFLLSHKGF